MPDSLSPACPKCHSRRTSRVKREGFLQTVVYPYLERYPWECSACRSIFTFKSRGRLKRPSRLSNDGSIPASGSEMDQPALGR